MTVGGFDSENDPEIKRLAEIFMAKYKADERNEYALEGESLSSAKQRPFQSPVTDLGL